jgi:hypothetical protein
VNRTLEQGARSQNVCNPLPVLASSDEGQWRLGCCLQAVHPCLRRVSRAAREPCHVSGVNARGSAQFGAYGPDMIFHCLWTDEEVARDFSVGHSAAEEMQHFLLSLTQAVNSFASRSFLQRQWPSPGGYPSDLSGEGWALVEPACRPGGPGGASTPWASRPARTGSATHEHVPVRGLHSILQDYLPQPLRLVARQRGYFTNSSRTTSSNPSAGE